MYEKVIEALKRTDSPLEQGAKCRSVRILIDAVRENSQGNSQFKLSPLSEIQPLTSDLLESENEEYKKTVKEFVAWFTDHGSTGQHLPFFFREG